MTGKPELEDCVLLRDVGFRLAATAEGEASGGPLSLSVRRGEFVSLLGPPGCGNELVLRMIAGFIPPATGEIWLSGKRVNGPQQDLGIVFQNPALLPWRTVLANVTLQAEIRKLDLHESLLRARRLLGILGLSRRENEYPGQLLPAEAQRVSICRALVHDPPLLLMNDPFRILDPIARHQLALDVQRLPISPERTTLLATAEIAESVQLSDRVVVLSSQGTLLQALDIDLPRPRRLDKITTPRVAQYCSDIRTIFHAHGVLS